MKIALLSLLSLISTLAFGQPILRTPLTVVPNTGPATTGSFPVFNADGTWHFSNNGSTLTNLNGGVIDVTLPPFNAVGNGVFNCTQAFSNALIASAATGLPVMVRAGTYFLDNIAIYTNQSLIGVRGAKLWQNPADTGVFISMDQHSSNYSLEHFEIIGNGNLDGSLPPSQYPTTGVLVYNAGAPNMAVHDLYLHGFGIAVDVAGGVYNEPDIAPSYIYNLKAHYNGIAIKFEGLAEYNALFGLSAWYNRCGLYEIAANNQFVSGSFGENLTNLYMDGTFAGANPLHCTFDGVTFNHAQNYSIWADSCTFGAIFNGCYFLPAKIWITNCNGIKFTGCGWGWNDTTTSFATFTGCTNCSVINPANPYYSPGGLDFCLFNSVTNNSNVVVQLDGVKVVIGLSTTNWYPDLYGFNKIELTISNNLFFAYLTNGPAAVPIDIRVRDLGATNHVLLIPTQFCIFNSNYFTGVNGSNWTMTITNGHSYEFSFQSAGGTCNPNATNSVCSIKVE
jgi:hypothetical protein